MPVRQLWSECAQHILLEHRDIQCFLGAGNYGANAGPGWLHWTEQGKSWDGTSGGGGTQISFDGGVFAVNYGIRFAEIIDGTSNTIAFNELRVGINQGDRRGAWAMGVSGASITAAHATGDATGAKRQSENADDIEDCTALRAQDSASRHVGMGDMRMGCSIRQRPDELAQLARPGPQSASGRRAGLLRRWQHSFYSQQYCHHELESAQ